MYIFFIHYSVHDRDHDGILYRIPLFFTLCVLYISLILCTLYISFILYKFVSSL